jgi:tetratricopeptide (TPR) repeat protein
MKVCPFIAFVREDLLDPSAKSERVGDAEIAPPVTDLDEEDSEEAGAGRGKGEVPEVIELGAQPIDPSDDEPERDGMSAREYAETIRDRWARDPSCLGSMCRFFEEQTDGCGFERLLVESQTDSPAGEMDLTVDFEPLEKKLEERIEETQKKLGEDIDRIWSFQKRSVTEIIGSLGDFSEFRDEFLERTKEQAQETNELLRSLKEQMGSERKGLREDLVEAMEKSRGRIEQLEKKLEERWSDFEALTGRVEGMRKDVGERLKNFEHSHRENESLAKKLTATHDEMLKLIEQEKETQARHEEEMQREQAKRLNNAGVHCFHNGDYAEALKYFERALELDPELTEALNNMGLTYTEMGEEEEAIEAFKTAIKLNPDLPATYNNMGYVFYLKGDFKQAIEMYNEALGRTTRSSSAYTNLGNAYYKLDQREKAIEAWKKALEIDPSNEKAKRNLKRFQKVSAES